MMHNIYILYVCARACNTPVVRNWPEGLRIESPCPRSKFDPRVTYSHSYRVFVEENESDRHSTYISCIIQYDIESTNCESNYHIFCREKENNTNVNILSK